MHYRLFGNILIFNGKLLFVNNISIRRDQAANDRLAQAVTLA